MAGVQESIYCILMMQHRFLCESANIETLDPLFEDMPILRQRRDNVDLFVLFPDGRISEVQRRMMTSVADANVHTTGYWFLPTVMMVTAAAAAFLL